MILSIFSHAYCPCVCLLWRNVYLDLLPILWLGSLFLLLSCKSWSCILGIKPFWAASFENLFSQSAVCLFCFVHGFLCCAKVYKFDEDLFLYCFSSSFCFLFYNLYNFQRLYNYTEKKKQKQKRRGKQPVESHRILLQNALALKFWRKNKTNGTEANLQSDELA